MRTERSELDIRKDFGFYDLGFTAAVGAHNIAVYEHLRRFIWRKGAPYENGVLQVRASQSLISVLTGLRRETINRSVAKLKSIGWVRTEGEREDLVYILGEVIVDRSGGKHEVYFADAVCAYVAERIGDSSQMTPEERVARVQEELGVKNGLPLVILDHNLVTVDHNPCDLGSQPCDLGSHISNNREVENLEVSNLIHPSGGAFGSAAEPRKGEDGDSPPYPLTLVEKNHAAVTRRVDTISDGVPRPVPDHRSVPERIETAQGLLAKAQERGRARRQQNYDRQAQKDAKLRNLGGKRAEDDPLLGRAVRRLERCWREEYKQAFPDVPISKWAGRENGQVRSLVVKYDVGKVESCLRYVVANWDKLGPRFKNGPKFPSVGFILGVHDTIVPEADAWIKVASVKEEWDAWWKANPGKFDPPDDLERRYDACRKELSRLGLL